MDRATRHRGAGRRRFSSRPTEGDATPTRLRGHGLRMAAVALLAVALTIAVAACGSSSKSSSSGTPSSTSSPGGGGSSGSGGGSADVAAATAAIAKYINRPSAFPATTPLKKAVKPGSKFVYLQASDPIGALLGQLLKPAVQAVGATYVSIPAGETASTAQAAASSAIALKPTVVLIPAFEPSEFGGKLQTLRSQGATIIGAGMVGWQKYGISWCNDCAADNVVLGKLMADWVIAHKGLGADAAFYTVPELPFTASMWTGFKTEMSKLCAKCAARAVSIDVSTIGTTAPQKIVNDLQSHSGTNVAVFSTMDMAQGLPSAMSAAGVHDVTTLGQSPTPENLEDIKAGKLTAGLAIDLNTYVWTLVDAGAKLATGQTPDPKETFPAIEFLQQKNITFNPKAGWPGYPNFAQRFEKLWHRG